MTYCILGEYAITVYTKRASSVSSLAYSCEGSMKCTMDLLPCSHHALGGAVTDACCV